MSTPCESVYDVFFDLIEEDRDFFNYYEATDEESYMLALQRAKALLRDAAIRMQMECDAEIDFTDTYTEGEGRKQKEFFTADLTPFEIDLLANLMYEGYLSEMFPSSVHSSTNIRRATFRYSPLLMIERPLWQCTIRS